MINKIQTVPKRIYKENSPNSMPHFKTPEITTTTNFLCILIDIHMYKFQFIIFFLKNRFYLFLVVLGLRCCAWAFSSCVKRGLLLVAVRGLLIVVASLVVEHGLQVRGFSSCGTWAQQLWLLGSRAQAQQLWHTGLVAPWHVGIFLDQGSNPCPLHQQADS